MQIPKKCVFSSNKNCFLHLAETDLKETNLTEKVFLNFFRNKSLFKNKFFRI